MSVMKEISVQDAKGKLNQYRLIDVREADEWHGELGHIEGAELIPMGEITSSLHIFNQSESLLLICRSGNRSGNVGQYLAAKGYQVTNLVGGMLSWNAHHYPVVRS